MRVLQKARSKRQREEVDRLWTILTYSPPRYISSIRVFIAVVFDNHAWISWLSGGTLRKIVVHNIWSFRLLRDKEKSRENGWPSCRYEDSNYTFWFFSPIRSCHKNYALCIINFIVSSLSIFQSHDTSRKVWLEKDCTILYLNLIWANVVRRSIHRFENCNEVHHRVSGRRYLEATEGRIEDSYRSAGNKRIIRIPSNPHWSIEVFKTRNIRKWMFGRREKRDREEGNRLLCCRAWLLQSKKMEVHRLKFTMIEYTRRIAILPQVSQIGIDCARLPLALSNRLRYRSFHRSR